MKSIATFEKVTGAHEGVMIPRRATSGSAGYDFYAPYDFEMHPGQTVTIHTGIRCRMDEGWVLMLFPRSGLGFKHRIRLENTVGVIDSDYYYSDNEGEIIVKMTYCKDRGEIVDIPQGKAFCQGVFIPFGIVSNEEDNPVTDIRNGGQGSTDKR